jgi:hypothetical protein
MSSTKIVTNLFHPTLELNEQRATATRYRRTHLCYMLQSPFNICLMSFSEGNLCLQQSVLLPTLLLFLLFNLFLLLSMYS